MMTATERAKGFAKKLRRQQTIPEKIIWKKVRARRFHGYKFRRQVPVGPFIVDFLCFEKRLIIEIDGDSHWQEGAQEYDRGREEYLRMRRFRVIRFSNKAVLYALGFVLETMKEELEVVSSP